MGVSPGVALSPATPLSTLDYILEDIDRVLLLTVNPGFHSQPIVKQSITKIHKLSMILEETSTDKVSLVVDGHVNLKTIPEMYRKGAREFVLGKSGLFGNNTKKNLDLTIELLESLSKSLKMKFSVNTGFLVNRYPSPDQWCLIIKELQVKNIQITADLFNPTIQTIFLMNKLNQ